MQRHLLPRSTYPFSAVALASLASAAQTPQGGALDAAPPASLSASTAAASTNPPSAIEVIFTNRPGLPTSEVPGIPGRMFKIGNSGDRFGEIYGSPNGNWIMTARTEANDARDEVLLVNGQVVYQEDVPAPWVGGVENSGGFRTRTGINDAGDFVFTVQMPGGVDHIVKTVQGAFEGVAIPGSPVPAFPLASHGPIHRVPNILADGTIAYYTDDTQGPFAANEQLLVVLDDELLLQSGVSVPPGQRPGSALPFQFIKVPDLWMSSDGDNWLVRGDLEGSTNLDDVVIVNGDVVAQERTTLPGFQSEVATNGIRGASMDAAGNWFARGSNVGNGLDWILRNGEVIALTDGPVVPGTDERYDDSTFGPCFFLHAGNSQGDYVLGGVTDAASNRNGVLVKNGDRVIAREGDPIDMDGNGLFDDGFVLAFFSNDRAHLSDDGLLIIELQIRRNFDNLLSRAVLRIDTNAPEIGQPYCVAAANSTGAPAFIGAFGSADVSDNDLKLVATGLPQNAFGFFLTSRDQGFVANPGSSAGNLCLAGDIGRFVAPGQIQSSGSEGAFELRLDLQALAQSTGSVAVMPLDTWNFQAWHRDTVLGIQTSNFTDGVSVDFE